MADVFFTFDGGVCRERGVGGPANQRLETVLVEAALNGDEITFVFRVPEEADARRGMIQEALLPFAQCASTPLIKLRDDGWVRIQRHLDPANTEHELAISFWMPIEGVVNWPEWVGWRKHLAAVQVTYIYLGDDE